MGLDVTYKGSQIARLTEDGNLTLETAGKYCEDDIELAYSGGGGADFLQYATSIQYTFSYMMDGPDVIELNLPNVKSFTYGMSSYWQPRRFILHLSEDGKCTGMLGACRWMWNNLNISRLEYIKITGDLSHVTTYQSCFYNVSDGTPLVIDADLDFTSCTTVFGMFSACWDLVSVRFVQNTLALSLDLGACRLLNQESLVSVANGLNESAQGQSIKLHENFKSAIDSNVGNVSLNESQTYHIFTLAEDGDTSLRDFITQTKGWTITWRI